MPIKDVFLPLVGQPRGPALAAIATCVAVAADLGARITALALEEDDFVRPKVTIPGDLDSAEASGSRELSNVQQLLNAFTNAASSANIRAQTRSGKVPADQVASILAEHARFSDLTLVPVRPHDSRTERIIETLLFESGRPLLLCPEQHVDKLRPEFENVMIAWDHSARAARAVGDALPILQAAASVRVVTVADDPTDAIVQSGTALVDHLREHGVYASFETAMGRGSSIGKVLGSWANSHAMDAIVMGAYHHSRLNEIVWGGVTKTIIGQPPCWVMISH
ncbi:universal stress protein [Bradyrhizobium japonicum]|uniref:universal stress protein n=1 Tax=Bradyrhizobium japonicum TaxID=375 RepID=UPI0020A156CB|nr:universal stress protein [Bradyrhizobium japonicum]MCP1764352.1 nucleotide-binding universal stress UspA family protein [Bradyrhizobium japonicum]MCP1786489.1 nucleotide-binding universal stress UspA family protein [Bradyrhizobium japonicum]MCP1808368.1 nucleotide-binding universal stress UspA family protein [Bradyrhizobium japonicum]MCP1817295.1 nucleotide-binding universal stress UspA family protein [Bradyrhizobium japonicum]MCP1871193.1 nucleotide-binding universal stress UspA family pro